MTDTLTDYDPASTAAALLEDENARSTCFHNVASSFAEVLALREQLDQKVAVFSAHRKEAQTKYGLTDARLRQAGIDPSLADVPAAKSTAKKKTRAPRSTRGQANGTAANVAPAADAQPAPEQHQQQ